MKKTSLFTVLIVLFFTLTLSQSAKAYTSSVVPLPDTTEGIHLALVHESHASINSENGIIDYVWGSQIPQPGHTAHKDYYQKFDRAGSDPGTSAFPTWLDKAWFLKNHPNWLVYLCDKTTLAYEYGDPNVPLDITNPAVRQFMMDTWIKPALDKGYDGVSFDNVNLDNMQSAGRCGVWTTDSKGNKVWDYLYYGDAQNIHGIPYSNSVVIWAKAMYAAIHAYSPQATVTMNYTPMNGGDMHGTLAFNEQLIPYSDNMLNEGGFTDGLTSPFTIDRYWQLENGFARDLAAQGKGQVLIFGFKFSTLTDQQKLWALSNYLLVKGNHTYMVISSGADNGGQYGHFNLIPEYSMQIGHPINLMYQSQKVYMRDFSGGKAIVNPSLNFPYTITIPAGLYTDTSGNPVAGDVIVGMHSGLVLLNTAAHQ